MALDADLLIGTHSADCIMAQGKNPVKDAGDMESIRIRQLKNPLTQGAGPDMQSKECP